MSDQTMKAKINIAPSARYTTEAITILTNLKMNPKKYPMMLLSWYIGLRIFLALTRKANTRSRALRKRMNAPEKA
ncbi:MAG: hypothetical protein WC565_01145 [Parcubacteria group bacterium]